MRMTKKNISIHVIVELDVVFVIFFLVFVSALFVVTEDPCAAALDLVETAIFKRRRSLADAL